MPLTLELRPFRDCNPEVLASQLSSIVRRSTAQLARDFPQVVARYLDPGVAFRSVKRRCKDMENGTGSYGSYVVLVGGRVVGAASYQQFQQKDYLTGPLIAGWLDAERTGAERGIGTQLLLAAAAKLGLYDGILHGTPWTVVRTDHPRVPQLLQDPNNGFGGFTAEGAPQIYNKLDGVHVLRQLYVSRRTVAELATA